MNTTELLALLEQIRDINDMSSFSQALLSLVALSGCDYYLFRLFKPSDISQFQLFIDSNYPRQWLEAFILKGIKQGDPVMQYCWQSRRPVFWHQLREQETAQERSKTALFWDKAAAAGLQDALSVPVQGGFGEFGLLSLTFSRDIEPSQKEALALKAQLCAPYIQEAVNRFWRQQRIDYRLSPRERECLSWACQGKTTREIAAQLNLAESTVNFHLNNTITKTKAVNRQQAIAKALLSGVLLEEQISDSRESARSLSDPA